jgi:ADP-ribosyl-[dinitrogen reductase] hydrolase
MDRNKFRGCFLGQAVGDAVGTTNEFKPKGSFTPIMDMVGGGPFRLKRGQFTDDHSMGLCMAASFVEASFNSCDMLDRFCRWRDHGYMSATGTCFDIGSNVSAALDRYERFHKPYSGSTTRNTAGNGSLMRQAAVPMVYAIDPVRAALFAADASRTTHAAPQAVDACRFYAELVAHVLNGVTDVRACSTALLTANLYDSEIAQAVAGACRKPYDQIFGTGYVVQSLEAALWCFYHSSTFEEGCLLAANLGDDADTTAAIYGQLAGAYYGLSGIPERWVNWLAMRDLNLYYADELFALSARSMR